jgi:PhnB protein
VKKLLVVDPLSTACSGWNIVEITGIKSRLRSQEEAIMKIQPYLVFSGDCETALNFYQSCLGGEITFKMTHGESPMKDQVPAEWHGKIMHATYTVDGQSILGSDRPPGMPGPTGFCGFSLSVSYDDAATGERIFKALSEGGQINMPFAATFWAKGFGMCVDRFGVHWMVNCE